MTLVPELFIHTMWGHLHFNALADEILTNKVKVMG